MGWHTAAVGRDKANGWIETTRALLMRIYINLAPRLETSSMKDTAIRTLVGVHNVLPRVLATTLAVRSGPGRDHCTCNMTVRNYKH